MIALRECPFCGEPGEAYMHPIIQDHKMPWAGCRECGFHLSGTSQKAAIAAWNRRADDRYTLTPLGAAMLEGKK